jgi:hypothetical protein
MHDGVRVRGRLTGKRIELDEEVEDLEGEVEVVVRPAALATGAGERFLDVVGDLPAGTLSKDDIDQQLRAARAEWNDRA